MRHVRLLSYSGEVKGRGILLLRAGPLLGKAVQPQVLHVLLCGAHLAWAQAAVQLRESPQGVYWLMRENSTVPGGNARATQSITSLA